MNRILVSFLALLIGVVVQAQDTTVVQCFTFDDITKRRGVYEFPDENQEFRKILMKYTLKCDPKTTADNYQCGEWDYLTYTFVYDHSGEIDSTYQSRKRYQLGNSTPDEIETTNAQPYQYSLGYLTRPIVDSVKNGNSSQVGAGTTSTSDIFDLNTTTARSQFLWTKAELDSNGVDSGAINGIQLDFGNASGAIKNLKIRLGHTSSDSLYAPVRNMTEVYYFSPNITGNTWNEFVFLTPFYWNNTDNIVVEFSYQQDVSSSAMELNGESPNFKSGVWLGGTDYVIALPGGGSYLDFGRYATFQGGGQKTVELWSKVNVFNNAGLFEIGTSGTGRDYSLRTTTTNNKFRVQHWGAPDYDVTVSGTKDNWRHYAVSYDGSTSRFYVDGKQVGSKNANLNTGANNLWVGRWQGSYLNGDVSQFRCWDTVLTGQEIRDYYQKQIDASHPKYNSLVADHPLNEGQGVALGNTISGNHTGGFIGRPSWKKLNAEESFVGHKQLSVRPNIKFLQGEYFTHLDSLMVRDSVAVSPVAIYEYNNPSGFKIDDGAPNHPSMASDTIVTWLADYWIYDTDIKSGAVVDSHFVTSNNTLTNSTVEWYSSTARFEIGRFITPYGIGLTLGPDGFTWWYDVTDYAPLFHDSVDISAGNNQELIDLQFLMIEGTPARKVKAINRVWGPMASIKFRDLADDSRIEPKTVELAPNTETYKMLTRLTGHGHNSNNGSYPHCCEWRDNEHYFSVDGTQIDTWHIWQTKDCAQNPVYPQGGTWPGAREGWCPGDVVKNHEIEITPYINGNSVELDYDISKVPQSNLGMGDGNYVVAMHFFQYEEAAYDLDAEVYEVINPSSNAYYSRRQVVCEAPLITIRNAGKQTLTSVDIYYNVEGGHPKLLKWTGNLEFMEMETLELPFAFEGYYKGDSRAFTAYVVNPNGGNDENGENDSFTSTYEPPQRFENDLVLIMRTNNNPNENQVEVRDIKGNIVFSKYSFSANTEYRDTLDFAPGCYVMSVKDNADDGLSYWANPGQGTGYLRIMGLDSLNKLDGIFIFEPEFGHELTYSFTVGTQLGNFPKPVSIQEQEQEGQVLIYPNPSNGLTSIELAGLFGEYTIEITDLNGKLLSSTLVNTEGYLFSTFDFSNWTKGVYLVNVRSENDLIRKKLIIGD